MSSAVQVAVICSALLILALAAGMGAAVAVWLRLWAIRRIIATLDRRAAARLDVGACEKHRQNAMNSHGRFKIISVAMQKDGKTRIKTIKDLRKICIVQ